MSSKKFDVIALANTFAIIDLILHPLFHIWVSVHPQSYEWLMHLLVAGLEVKITAIDTSLQHIILGTVIEASVFWLLGAGVALIYNKLTK